jgi:hypothetical protein
MDLGSGAVEGAKVLTREILPPGTDAYRSPEAWAYHRFNVFQLRAHYEATASDDLFALGITAYRLVTDEYPPPTQPEAEGAEVWQWDAKGPRAPSELNPQVCEELDALILRLLAVHPYQRFSGDPVRASQAAARAAREAGPKADELLFAWETQPAAEREVGRDPVSQRLGHRPRRRDAEVVQRAKEQEAGVRAERELQEAQEQQRAQAPTEKVRGRFPFRRLLFPVALLGLLVLFAVDWPPSTRRQWEPPAVAQAHSSPKVEGIAGGLSGLGEDFAPVAPKEAIPPSGAAVFADKVPKTPLDGQRRAPCKERQIKILGGCWYEAPSRVRPPCEEGTYEWEGICYVPVLRHQRDPASEDK